ncbi:MAG: peptide deformylase [Gammaproteobacteria bacterium]
MAIRQILHHPDPRLRVKAETVSVFDDALRQLVDDMLETMYDAPGIGLAATQVNVHQRVIVVDVSRDGSAPLHFVNPRLLTRDGEEEMEEGCLSVPGVFETVRRADRITLAAEDCNGRTFEMAADGLLAVCIQHEIDHLDGKLFVDYLSQLKQSRIRKKLTKEQRLAG